MINPLVLVALEDVLEVCINHLVYDHVCAASHPLICRHLSARESDTVCRQGSSLAFGADPQQSSALLCHHNVGASPYNTNGAQ